ncbi:Coat F domain protein [Desulfotomaculum nigrificans CO-1-SRB]|uniref:Coat F domain protein n=1 Tax=Desulfotomaculum nigrificans (strain DSM 14880 / VKM B-2319 / CO-1-SRB) TaxID=868595 RepID=F6B606_DESCC|nr:spore coat protein [Desulfotomaculum nigrificans]AEF94325.1 Coat F domain protein [Desulfotomaculum nigrificans CO-1-SRB]
MRGDQVTDKTLCLAMLNELKWTATCLTNKILECADPQLRQDYIHVLNRTFTEQKSVFDFAHQQGWYKPTMAEQTQINKLQQAMPTMIQEQQQSMASIHQQAQHQAIQTTGYAMNNMNQGMVNYQDYMTPAYYTNNQTNYGGIYQQNYGR